MAYMCLSASDNVNHGYEGDCDEDDARTSEEGKEAMGDAEGYIRALAAILATHPKVIEHDPELAALADEAKAQADALRKARLAL